MTTVTHNATKQIRRSIWWRGNRFVSDAYQTSETPDHTWSMPTVEIRGGIFQIEVAREIRDAINQAIAQAELWSMDADKTPGEIAAQSLKALAIDPGKDTA